MAKPYLRCHHRFKNGKDHCYYSIAEKVKTRCGWIQRHLLYLGEINDSQKASWTKATKRKYGYSRDKRSDCVQVVIALVVTPEGFPLAYEVMAGNTSDKTTLRVFLEKIEKLYGKAERIWVMDRGIP